MTPRVPLGIALAIVVVFSAHATRAQQCPFPHPAKAAKFRAEFVQAFVGCRTDPDSCCNQANAVTESNVPSCLPAESFAENGGSQPTSWIWGPNSHGSVSLAAAGGDVRVSVQLSGVWDGQGPVTANGTFAMVLRATIYDPATGTMTAIDAPMGLSMPVVNGKGKLKATLADADLPPGLSGVLTGPCTSLELVVPGYVRDPNGNPFATVGFFLP